MEVVTDCECIHPLYLDFDNLRNHLSANETNPLKPCNLTQGGKYCHIWRSDHRIIENIIIFIHVFLKLDANKQCTDKVLQALDQGNRTCPCGVDCEEIAYDYKMSASLWPSRYYEVNHKTWNFLQKLLSYNGICMYFTDTHTLIL